MKVLQICLFLISLTSANRILAEENIDLTPEQINNAETVCEIEISHSLDLIVKDKYKVDIECLTKLKDEKNST